jgi:hypothetical protein
MNPPGIPNYSSVGGEPIKYKTPKTFWDALSNMFLFLNDKVMAINNSKIFAGIIIVTMNVASKFVVFKLSKSMEAYLKYTFSRDILVFAMAWMGTRDIYVALLMTVLFIICMKYLLNEESPFCCLPEKFTEYHISLSDENEKVTEEQIRQAKEILERAEKQQPIAEDVGIEKITSMEIPSYLNKMDRKIQHNMLLDEEPYHPYD